MATVTIQAMIPSKDTLTDLHTHILPAFDDGAENLEMALQMLRMQKERGIHRVALTSHFYPMREELDGFLRRRQRAYTQLLSGWDEGTMPSLRLGAEVRYSPKLAEMDLRQLTLGESGYLLLELPDTGVPAHLEQVVEKMLWQGITPIFAHVERCAYFRAEPERLLRLVQMDALAQVTAKALKDRNDRGFARACLHNGLAQMIASDIHTVQNARLTLDGVAGVLSEAAVRRAEEFARAVWDNERPPAFTIYSVKKGLLGYS